MCVFAFLMTNALFILVVFLLQLNKEQLHFDWPFHAKNEITFDDDQLEIIIKRTYLKLEPVGFILILFFGIVLVVQFIAMLIHRFKTISQILAATEINWYFNRKAKQMSPGMELRMNGVDIARRLQRPKPQWDENELDDVQKNIGRRDTVHRILYQHEQNVNDQSNLEQNFKVNYFGDSKYLFFGCRAYLQHSFYLQQRVLTWAVESP